jgi:hypothetical protein
MSTTRQLLGWIVESPQEIVSRHPVQNRAWDFHASDGVFIAEISSLRGPVKLDPWDRPIPAENLTPLRSAENEIYAWTGFTTVEGEQVKLTIFNT